MVAHSRAPIRVDRLRALNEPVKLLVVVDDEGLPVEVVEMTERRGRWGRRVEAIIETWRIDDEWWRHPINRHYVNVVLEDGGHVVLFEDLTTGEWFMQRP